MGIRTTLYGLLVGLSLTPSPAFGKPTPSGVDAKIAELVALMKTNPTTKIQTQTNYMCDGSFKSHHDVGIICPAKKGISNFYIFHFKDEMNRDVVLTYDDNDDNCSQPQCQYFQSDGKIGGKDSLTVRVTPSQNPNTWYSLEDRNLDGKLEGFRGDVLERGLSPEDASDYYFREEDKINQKYLELVTKAKKELEKNKP